MKKDIEFFELEIYKSYPTNINNYYQFLDNKDANDLVFQIFEKLKEQDNFSIRNLFFGIGKMLENHININFLNFLFIKTMSDIFYLYSSIFLVKSFQVCLISSDDGNLNINNFDNVNYKNFVDSDILIN
jgi:hypothetical protein